MSLTVQVLQGPGETPLMEPVEIPILQDAYFQGPLLGKLAIPSQSPSTLLSDPQAKVPLRLFDPGYKNTIVCKTGISRVDPQGKLYYRGYDVEDLVEKSNYLEVAFLLIHGKLPSQREYDKWAYQVLHHTYLHSELEGQMKTFRYDAHPMGMFLATMASLSTFHPDANPALQGVDMYMRPKNNTTTDPADVSAKVQVTRDRAIFRMLGKSSTIAANTYRHRIGRPYNHPMPGCTNYAENILYMMDRLNEADFRPDSRLVRILDKLLILMAEHGSNCSAVTMRHLTSSGVDPYTALAGAGSALFGERKSAAVIDMLKQIGSVDNIPSYLESIKTKQPLPGSKKAPRLLGFGHRIYKGTDPRVKICKALALELFDLMGRDSMSTVAIALEERALNDQWFSDRSLYPNIDYWAAIVFHTLGFPQDMFPVWMMIPRVAGFIAHWQEALDDPEYKIYRPRQMYTGITLRKYEKVTQPPNMSPSLSTQDYLKSDPQAALRRTTADPRSLPEILGAISKTETEIASLKSELSEAQASAQVDDSGAMAWTNALLSISWITQQFPKTKSVSEVTSKLDQLQAELKVLKEKQRALVVFDNRPGSPHPDLKAGSNSSRVIAKKE